MYRKLRTQPICLSKKFSLPHRSFASTFSKAHLKEFLPVPICWYHFRALGERTEDQEAARDGLQGGAGVVWSIKVAPTLHLRTYTMRVGMASIIAVGKPLVPILPQQALGPGAGVDCSGCIVPKLIKDKLQAKEGNTALRIP